MISNPTIKRLNTDFCDENEGKFVVLSISKLKNNNSLSKATIGVRLSVIQFGIILTMAAMIIYILEMGPAKFMTVFMLRDVLNS